MSFADVKGGKTYYGRRGTSPREVILEEAIDDESRTIPELVQDFQRFTTTLAGYEKKLGGWEDTIDLRARMHKTIAYAKNLADSITKRIIAMTPTNVLSETDLAAFKLQQHRYVKDFEKQLRAFQEVSNSALRKESSCAAHTPTAAERHRLELERQKQLEEEQKLMAESRIQYQETMYLQDVIRDRREGMAQVQQNIREVNRIFTQLAGIVKEQQADIDTIEAQVHEGKETANLGLQELQKAQQRTGTSLKCQLWCLFSVCLIITIFVLLISNAH